MPDPSHLRGTVSSRLSTTVCLLIAPRDCFNPDTAPKSDRDPETDSHPNPYPNPSPNGAPRLISPVTRLESVSQRRVAHADVYADAQSGGHRVHGFQMRPGHLLRQRSWMRSSVQSAPDLHQSRLCRACSSVQLLHLARQRSWSKAEAM